MGGWSSCQWVVVSMSPYSECGQAFVPASPDWLLWKWNSVTSNFGWEEASQRKCVKKRGNIFMTQRRNGKQRMNLAVVLQHLLTKTDMTCNNHVLLIGEVEPVAEPERCHRASPWISKTILKAFYCFLSLWFCIYQGTLQFLIQEPQALLLGRNWFGYKHILTAGNN
jgi:hypothetical protein